MEVWSMVNFQSFHGTVTMISDFMTGVNDEEGCYTLMSVDNGSGNLVNFVVSPTTYFVDHAMVGVGDRITAYYDGNAAVPLIFPPQYRAIIIVKEHPNQNVKVDFFNSQLESSDGQLKLNISSYTPVLLPNGQPYRKSPANKNLIVIYGPTTRSIPAQTNPYEIIVWC